MGRVITTGDEAAPQILKSTSFDGLHTIEFNEGSHRYKMDGFQTVGVTTYIKAGYPTAQGLIQWYKSQTGNAVMDALTVPGEGGLMPREGFFPIDAKRREEIIAKAKLADKAVSQEAADIGTICHGYAELHSLGKVLEAEALLDKLKKAETWPLIESCVSKYKAWAAKDIGVLVHAEVLVGSPRYLFCGKLDRLDNVNGKLRIRDYKTSKDIFLEQYIQMAAYSLAVKEWLGLDVEELEVVRFGKDDGSFDTLVIDDPKEIKMFQEQAIRCRYTHEFTKMNNDPRWKWVPGPKGETK